MADFVLVQGELIALPRDCESDMAARAAFLATVLGTAAPSAPAPAEAPTPAKAPEEDA